MRYLERYSGGQMKKMWHSERSALYAQSRHKYETDTLVAGLSDLNKNPR
jgi:hypothetical protein